MTRKKERLLAFEAARKRRAMNNESGVNKGQGNEGVAPTHTRNYTVSIITLFVVSVYL